MARGRGNPNWIKKMPDLPADGPELKVAPKPAVVAVGDVFRHCAEAEHYCALRIVDGEVHYCTEKGGNWALIRDMPYFELKKKARAMPLANAEGLVAEGTWVRVENIKSRWQND